MRVGVDEAGKGPVLGPMIAAAVGVSEPAVLPDGVADSKRLSPERRERLAERLRADGAVRIGVAAVQVERIDDPATDMNSLAVAAQAEAVDAVLEEADANGVGGRADGVGSGADAAVGTSDSPDSGGNSGGSADSGSANTAVGANSANGADRTGVDSAGEYTAGNCTVLADACDTSEERFARRLLAACASDPELTARHGADDADPVVAAASVVAKVERDARVAALAERYGDVGSGYPSDPTTRQFLEAYVAEHDDLPDCARASWQTCADVLGAAAQSGLEEF